MKTLIVSIFFITFNILGQLNDGFYATQYPSKYIHNHEPSVAINPSNNSNFIIGTNYRQYSHEGYLQLAKIGYHYTSNYGIDWINNYLDYDDYPKFADPTIVFNNEGKAFLGYLGTGATENPSNSGIFVSISSNGGQSWNYRYAIAQKIWSIDHMMYDKPFLCVDNNLYSPNQNHIYLSFSKFNIDQWKEIQSSYYSPETGQFSNPITVNDPTSLFVGGSYPLIDKNGFVYIIFQKSRGISAELRIVKSTNGGSNFDAFLSGGLKEKIVSPILEMPDNSNILGFKGNSLSSGAVDLSSGQYANTIYIAWTQYYGESNTYDKTDICLSKSTNGGINWTIPVKINPETSGHQFFPALKVTDDGRLCILYYDIQDLNNNLVKTKLITSFDGGSTFYPDEFVNSLELPEFNHENNFIEDFIGDYISVAAQSNIIVPVWTTGGYSDYTQVIMGAALENKLYFTLKSEVNGNPSGTIYVNNQPYTPGSFGYSVPYYEPLMNTFYTEPYYEISGEYNKFRVWTGLNIFLDNDIEFIKLGYDDNNREIKADYRPACLYTVTNYFEGGAGGSFQSKWLAYGDYFSTNSGLYVYGFSNGSPYYDRYRLKVENIFSILNTNWNFLHWDDLSTNLERDVSILIPNQNFTANYKGHFRADNQNAYNPSQRKIVNYEYRYFSYYESLNKIWETTSEGGDYWSNEVDISTKHPLLSSTALYKNPSCFIMQDSLYLVFEYLPEGSNQAYICAVWGRNTSNILEIQNLYFIDTYDASYFGNANPVIAGINNLYEILVVYRKSAGEGAYYINYNRAPSNEWMWGQPEQLTGTTSSSTNFSIIQDKIALDNSYHIVYQELNVIKYLNLYAYPAKLIRNSSVISSGSGYSNHFRPSISTTSNNTIVVSWSADNGSGIGKYNDAEGLISYRALVRAMTNGTWGSFFVTGDNVLNTYNNSTDVDQDATVIAWNENNNLSSKFIRRISGGYDCIRGLGVNGIMPVISNGYSLGEIKSLVFNNSSLPYVIEKSSADFSTDCDPGGGGIEKVTNDVFTIYSRSGLINKNGIEFVFTTGDIVVDDSVISFIDVPDTITYNNTQQLNSALRTENFYLNQGSSFVFSNMYYVLNAEKADSMFNNEDEVSFRVELVSSINNIATGVFDNITYNRNNLTAYDNIAYNVDCSGIQPGGYYLRLVTEHTGGAELNLAMVYNKSSDLNKKTFTQILFDGKAYPEEFSLSQNYPNPFNPSTTINYQIPEDGMVTIKLYDILGKEIKTLAQGYKTRGRYSINFDASDLSSGIYIYRIQAGEYTASRKMTLIK